MDGGTSPLSDTITAVIKFWLTKAKEGDCHAYPKEPRGSSLLLGPAASVAGVARLKRTSNGE